MLKLRFVAVVGMLVAALSGSVATSTAGVAVPTDVVSISPSGVTVGVAHPITVTFAGKIPDRTAVERSVEITSPKTPAGNFTWLSDNVLQWSPTEFWPAHSDISVSVGGAKTNFQSGGATVGVASISNHTFTVSQDGEVLREMPASMGKYGHATPVGNFTALEKQSTVIMDSRTIGIPLDDPEGYKLTVYDAVRVTWGGVYVHGAPWSEGSQGYENVSHGCINLSAENAEWYFNMVRIGDPIIIEA
ncbi:L,D-transpeptidase family protein [Mycobacterium sp. 2YAF39]|uniref:L,D-transpeptidase n=1 Tax=Mycobacterium sp. 2YAF39 TaxID=3233033 RepID=UPI003F9A3520